MASTLKAISKELAAKIRPHVTGLDWENARDFVDQYTGNELDCTQLDLLTDWATQAVDATAATRDSPDPYGRH
jgi:hypothetical protein